MSRKTLKRSQKKSQEGGRRKHRGTRKGPSAWLALVKKTLHELRQTKKDASLGDAMKEASRRKKQGKM
jgi:hypothetical protein